MGRIISVTLPKGGVGKTTSAVSLAINFANLNHKTILVDLDPTASCSLSMGFNEENIIGDIFDVFSYSKSLESVIHSTEIANLDFIPQMKLNSIEEVRQTRLITNNYLLRNVLEQLRGHYEFIILDCPPYLFGPTSLALVASDSILIPIRTDEYSLDAVMSLLKRVEYVKMMFNSKLQIEGIFITAYENNIKAAFRIKSELYQKFPHLMLKKSIPKDANMLNVSFLKKPLSMVKPKSRAALAYKELAEEIILKSKMIF